MNAESFEPFDPHKGSKKPKESDKCYESDQSDFESLLPKHGGYRKLRSFQASLVVYHATLVFCDRFIDRRSRTHDQMVQAARSAPRNIGEGSVASGTSKKIELKLTGIAKATLEELIGDLQDYLTGQTLPLWDKNHPKAVAARNRYRNGASARAEIHKAPPEDAANILICLCHQASYLIKRQLERLERDFVEHGGVTERLYRVRKAARERQENASDPAPACPQCGKPMRKRIAQRGRHAGQPFWGCSTYPDCNGTRPA